MPSNDYADGFANAVHIGMDREQNLYDQMARDGAEVDWLRGEVELLRQQVALLEAVETAARRVRLVGSEQSVKREQFHYDSFEEYVADQEFGETVKRLDAWRMEQQP